MPPKRKCINSFLRVADKFNVATDEIKALKDEIKSGSYVDDNRFGDNTGEIVRLTKQVLSSYKSQSDKHKMERKSRASGNKRCRRNVDKNADASEKPARMRAVTRATASKDAEKTPAPKGKGREDPKQPATSRRQRKKQPATGNDIKSLIKSLVKPVFPTRPIETHVVTLGEDYSILNYCVLYPTPSQLQGDSNATSSFATNLQSVMDTLQSDALGNVLSIADAILEQRRREWFHVDISISVDDEEPGKQIPNIVLNLTIAKPYKHSEPRQASKEDTDEYVSANEEEDSVDGE